MATLWAKYRLARVLLGGISILVIVGSLLVYTHRLDHPVLFYYGASPELPGGTAVAILNPFRNRKDEMNAEWLIQDLRTNKCPQIAQERLRTDPGRLCSVLQSNTTASLIWLDAESTDQAIPRSRVLFYDLPESMARLEVYFSGDEVGWGVSHVSLLQ